MDTAPTNVPPPSGSSIGQIEANDLPHIKFRDKLITWLRFTFTNPRYLITKVVSIALIVHGLENLYHHLYQIFYVFPHLPEIYKTLNFSPTIYENLIRRTLIVLATSMVETAFGLSLLTKHSKIIENFHVIAGVGIFLLSYWLLKDAPEIEPEALKLISYVPNLLFSSWQ